MHNEQVRLPRRARGAATKMAVGLLAAALVASTGAPAFAGAPHRERHGHDEKRQEQDVSATGKRRGNKNKTVKRTFANGNRLAIRESGAAGLYPSPIAVTGFKRARIVDVNLTLRRFSHVFPLDVDVMLVAPDGRNAVLLSDVGGNLDNSGVTDLTLTLDDEAAQPLPALDVLTNGSFRPLDDAKGDVFPAPAPTPGGQSALSTFDGIDPNGQWQFFISDDSAPDSGILEDGWSLEITAKSKGKGKKKR